MATQVSSWQDRLHIMEAVVELPLGYLQLIMIQSHVVFCIWT